MKKGQVAPRHILIITILVGLLVTLIANTLVSIKSDYPNTLQISETGNNNLSKTMGAIANMSARSQAMESELFGQDATPTVFGIIWQGSAAVMRMVRDSLEVVREMMVEGSNILGLPPEILTALMAIIVIVIVLMIISAFVARREL